ncbi:MAG: SCO family protein [Pseudomonadota bacterium]
MAEGMTRIMIMAGAALAIGATAGAAWLSMSGGDSDLALSPGTIDARQSDIGGGAFTMTAHTGEAMGSDELIDGPTLVYFGYTFCPDVCPFDVQDMASAVDMLAEKGVDVDPVFVTVDPLRDTPEQMAYFVGAMHPEMIGLTPDDATLDSVKREWKLYFQKGETGEDPEDYLMSHSSFTYFVTPENGVIMLFRSDQSPETMAEDVKRWMEAVDHPALSAAS